MSRGDYVIRVYDSPGQIDPTAWNDLLARQQRPTPFMRLEYLAALHASGSASAATGWAPRFLTLWQEARLAAACPFYLKSHSYGEYVFDWAWADAYRRHGLAYYPKGLVAVPFTPVPGSRLLARDAVARDALMQALLDECRRLELSSLHLLFLDDDDRQACERAGLTSRHTVQFHWENRAPTLVAARTALPPEGARSALGRPGDETDALPYRDFDDFLTRLNQEKRKKIRQEQRKVAEAGVSYRYAHGSDITPEDWEFFYRCYQQTYAEHGNPPYLAPAFFLEHMTRTMPDNWLLFVAQREGRPIACSLIALDVASRTAYGRYWGALARVDCLHFDLCYYQPLAWCIEHGYRRFEGGAQGEHKLSRALMPVLGCSAHWLAHPAFAEAVDRALVRERAAVADYLAELDRRSPFRRRGE